MSKGFKSRFISCIDSGGKTIEYKYDTITYSNLERLLNTADENDIPVPGVDFFVNPASWLGISRYSLSYTKSYFREILQTYHNLGYKLSLSQIRILKKRYNNLKISCNYPVKFEITKNLVWTPGDFGDGTSCYFGGKAAARQMMFNHGAFIIKFYNMNDDKLGRCLGYLDGDVLILWNGYYRDIAPKFISIKDSLVLDTYRAILTQYFGVYCNRIKLVNNGKGSGTLHINMEYGHILGANVDLIVKTTKVDLNWPEIKKINACNYCDYQDFNEANFVTESSHNHRMACQRCADLNFDACCYDMQIYDKHYLKKAPDGLLYYVDNFIKTGRFVKHYRDDVWLLKSKARLVGKNAFNLEVWLKEEDNSSLCESCKLELIGNNKKLCKYCEAKENVRKKLIEEFDSLLGSGSITKSNRSHLIGGKR